MEGPHDKVVIFIHVDDPEASVLIPDAHPELPSLSYLAGHTLSELIGIERVATAEALRRAGRPNATIHLDRIGARELGGLFMLLQLATVYAGALYGVDPLDQPGVEMGKRLIYGLMGRAGAEHPDVSAPDPTRIV